MMNEEVKEIYRELWELCTLEHRPLLHRYRSLRESFERVIREQMQHASLQATDLAARINYLSTQFGLDGRSKHALHTFRLTSNDVLNHRKSPADEEFLRDVRSIAEAYQVVFDTLMPKELSELLPKKASKSPMNRDKMALARRIRVCFDYADDEFLYVYPVDELSDTYWKVRYGVLGVNDEFTEGLANL